MLYVITFIVGELFGVFAMCLLQIGRYNEITRSSASCVSRGKRINNCYMKG